MKDIPAKDGLSGPKPERMSFEEHLDVLRRRLIRCGWVLLPVVVLCLCVGTHLVKIVADPIVTAMAAQAARRQADAAQLPTPPAKRVRIHVASTQPRAQLQQAEKMTGGALKFDPASGDLVIEAEIRSAPKPDASGPKRLLVLGPTEGFITYLKVSLICGLIISSGWVLVQVWYFVRDALYRHERWHVLWYLLFSIGLFWGGVVFCYFLVFPGVLAFLLGFAAMMDLDTQIRLSEWVGFAVWLPLMFGLAFQVPIVMVLLNRLNIVTYTELRSKARIVILLAFIVAMFLTPPDPASQVLMALPMLLLYGVGLVIVRVAGKREAFVDQEPVRPPPVEPRPGGH